MVTFETGELKLLDHAMKQGFSEYIKKLIEQDMMRPARKPNIYEIYTNKHSR